MKASPVPSDPEKPGTPGEGMLSSDLDRISTEGEAVTHTCLCIRVFCGRRRRSYLWDYDLYSFSGGEYWAPSLAMIICRPVVSPELPSLPQ